MFPNGTTPVVQTYWDDLNEGDSVPGFQLELTQKKVVEQVNALRGTTEDLIWGNAEMLATQSGEIQRIAADPAVGAETLRSAFKQIYRTLDAIDTYKVQATEVMASTVVSLTAELQSASAYLERSRAQGALEGGLA